MLLAAFAALSTRVLRQWRAVLWDTRGVQSGQLIAPRTEAKLCVVPMAAQSPFKTSVALAMNFH
jgi:hypothetical protein